ncbi:MAG TPA: hypothetical protein VGI39_37680 [Polyangiaceae bacterium]
MSNRLTTLAALSLFSSLAACGAPSSVPSPSARAQTVRGTVALGAYAIDNPVIVGRTNDAHTFFAPVQADGSFALTFPAGASASLALANTTRAGGYVLISRILWPGVKTAWARLDGATAAIALGRITPVASGITAQDHGGSEGSSGGGGDDSSSSSGDGSDAGSGEIHTCGTAAPGRSELPYDVRPALGSTFRLDQAFLAKGPAPAAITSVTMQGGSWRLSELQSDTAFVVTQADCDHQGNRDVGRDRVVIGWTNADGSTGSDHLDLRYCDGSGSSSGSPSTDDAGASNGMDPNDCESDGTPVCSGSGAGVSQCDGHGGGMSGDDGDSDDAPVCPGAGDGGAAGNGGSTEPPSGAPGSPDAGTAGGGGNGSTAGGGAGQPGDACVVNADCTAGLVCIASVCGTTLVK